MSDGEQVEVLGTPRQRRDGQLLHLVVAELPQRQQRALAVAVLVRLVLVVPEICNIRIQASVSCELARRGVWRGSTPSVRYSFAWSS